MGDDSSEIQTVNMEEKSVTLNILLQLIYPIAPPTFPGMSSSGEVLDAKALVNGIEPVLAAAIKYEMQPVVKELCSKLASAADATLPNGGVAHDTLALRIFVLACRYGLKEEARSVAHASLRGRVRGVFIEELRQLNAVQYFHLIQFHDKTVAAIRPLFQQDRPPKPFSVLCPICSKQCPIRRWNAFAENAFPVLMNSPRSSFIFSTDFYLSVFGKRSPCLTTPLTSYDSRVPEGWEVTCRYLKEKIEEAVTQVRHPNVIFLLTTILI